MNDEKNQASRSDAFRDPVPDIHVEPVHEEHLGPPRLTPSGGPGGGFQPPPPTLEHPAPPAWALAVDQERPRQRRMARTTVNLVAIIALVLGLTAALSSTPLASLFGRGGGSGTGAAAPAGSPPPSTSASLAPGDGRYDLREAAVYLLSNDGKRNEVVAFARNSNGRLRLVGRFDTGGTGSGSFEDASQGLVLGTSEGEASPIHNVDRAELLFVTNAGSNSITTFRIRADRLELASTVPSGGEKPVSITVHHGLLYVLNSGEFDNRLAANPDDGLENCTTGQLPSVTGFRVTPTGMLTQIPGSTRLLTGAADSGCAQVSFTPDGSTLVVTERIGGKPGPEPPGDTAKGAIVTFPVHANGTLGAMSVTDPTSNGPFGFTFTRDGRMLMTEQNGAFDNVGGGTVASYRLAPGGSVPDPVLNGPGRPVIPVGGVVESESTDPCWIVLTNDQKLAFVSSAIGQISSFSVAFDGQMTLLHRAATAPDGEDDTNDVLGFGITDLALSRDSRYLYQLHSFEGKVFVFLVNPNGTLTYVEQHDVFDLSVYIRNEGPPYGIAAF